ncbi:MAG: zinc ribbon domain-containing protein [Nitrososphaera sp.]
MDTIKKIGDHEKRIANNIIHKITRDCQSSYRNRFVNSIRQTQRVAKPREEGGKRKRKEFNRKLSGFPYFKFTEYLTYKAALAGIKVIKIFENWTSQTCRSVTNEEQEGRRDCLCAKLVVKRMLIEMLLLISLTGLWDTFPK